jgi:RHS repeat-associated protein
MTSRSLIKPLTDLSVYTKGVDAQFPVLDLQYPQYVISQVESSDGVGGSTSVEYQYEGLKTHIQGRGSYGYAKIIEHYPDTNKTQTTTLDQRDFPYTGGVLSVVEEYNTQKVNESVNTMMASQTYPGVYQLNPQHSVQMSYELGDGNNPVTTVTTTSDNIDSYGNIGQLTITTSGSGESFTKITNSLYTNDTENWLLGRLTKTTVIHQSPYNDDESRTTDFAYDASTGLLTEERILSTLTGLPLITTHYTYDDFGQKTQTRLSASGETDRVTSTTYDALGRPSQTCNVLNQCENFTYTPQGWLASTTGPNNISTTWRYDGFGRQIREDRADGTWTATSRHFASGNQCGELASFAYSCTVTQTSGFQPATAQFDTLGREVRRIKQGFDERLVYSDTQYNAAAQVSRVSRDYYAGNHAYWATSEYDALNRVIRATEPGPHGTTNNIITEYNGLTITVRSGPEQRAKTTVTNAIGQNIRIEEEEGAYTEFTYNSEGNMLTARVAGDAATMITLTYDEFGRKIGMSDPDMGQWHYHYNAFGELTSQTDAKGQSITMQYDVLGRMSSRTEPEGTSTWSYGDNNAPVGSIGKLLQESGHGLTKNYAYDNLGRRVSTTTTIAGHGSFTEFMTYDSLGRVKGIEYPGSQGFYTENHYNDNGFLEIVSGLRAHAETHDYDALSPLINEAIELADDYLNKANELRAIGHYYQSQISYYQTLSGSGAVGSGLQQHLVQHQSQLADTVAQGQALSSAFLGHLNNTIIELQTITDLIETQTQSYESIAEQLVVLTEQTLAAADHSFQLVDTLDNAADAYADFEAEENTDTITYWRAVDVDASGRISAEVYGNGIVNDYAYNQATGQLQQIHSSLLVSAPIRHLEYQYDAYQNVTLRDDLVNDIRESFEYDRLDRLTATHVASDVYESISDLNTTQSLSYDVLGNITYKSDIGSYFYGSSEQPHAAKRAGSKLYHYDANGNMTSGDGRTIKWSSFNKPTEITQNNRSATFSYGSDRARFMKVNHQGNTTLYIGGLYEQLTKDNGEIERKHYIYAAGQLVAQHIVSTTQGTQTRYLHKDALGSIDLITDAHANVVDRRSFDAWGKLRNLPWQAMAQLDDPLYLTQLPFTNKGYTGHENVQEVNLIHMNGRMYDVTLARFISADPHIQANALSQNYNRYSYVMNNPMKYTDPSGFFFKKLFSKVKSALSKAFNAVKPYVGLIATLAVGAFCIPCTAGIISSAITGAAIGALSAAATGGNILQGALIGGFTAGSARWIGGANKIFGKARAFDIGRSLAHGAVGGITNVIRGGKFGAGFVSSAFTKFVSEPIQGYAENLANGSAEAEIFYGTAGAALVGGTASELGGGKFANGAQTSATQYLFNQISESLAISKKEREYAKSGDRKQFWTSRLEKGDPLAQTALNIVNNVGFLAPITNLRLSNALKFFNSPYSSEDVGIALMRSHMDAVTYDFEYNIGVPGALHYKQVDTYHINTFRELQIPSYVYGGRSVPGIISNRVYCQGCDRVSGGVR